MEYVRDEIFNIRYNEQLNKLELKKESWTSKLKSIIKNNKFITITLITFIMFSSLNFIMICNFIKLLENM